MRSRVTFYLFIAALIVLDAVLLRSPNLLGKIGLIIYKYDYLRTFPKALVTVTLVVGIAVLIAETIRVLVRQGRMRKFTGGAVLFLFLIASIAILVKTWIDFRAWSYSHTGIRFQLGAYLLPAILVIVFLYTLIVLKGIQKPFPLSPASGDANETEPHAQN